MEEDTPTSGGFDLSSFLSSGLSLYGQVVGAKNTTDQAKLQQQIAAQNAVASANTQNTLKQILLWGSVAVTGIFLLVFVIKALKK